MEGQHCQQDICRDSGQVSIPHGHIWRSISRMSEESLYDQFSLLREESKRRGGLAAVMEREEVPAGPIMRFLEEDHRRLEGLLNDAERQGLRSPAQAYDEFRAGLLRHIGMEEKILLPAAQRCRGGEPLPIAAKLRLDHGALAALLMPTPTVVFVDMIRSILKSHNLVEEGPGGLYETCEQLAGPEVDGIMSQILVAPGVTVMAYNDGPTVLNAVQRAVERAGYEFRESGR